MIVNPVPTANCTSENGTCANNNLGSESVTVTSGTAPFSYAWSNGATTSSISGLAAGTYSVTVTDAEGCSAQCSATVIVTPCCNVTDGGEIGYNQENCGPFDPTELVSLAPPTGGLGDLEVLWIYRVWTGSDWENDWHFVPGSHDLLSYDPGMISVSTQFRRCARRSGCEDYIGETNIITITINPIPTAQCSKTDVLCYGDQTGSASVSASGGTAPYSYVWSNGGTNAAISGIGAGTYSVTVTDAEGCTATCSVEVSQPQSALLATCEAGYVACYGESTGSAVVLAQGGTAPYSYLWSNGATNANIDGLSAGSYSVTITDANGCTASCSIEVIQPEAPLSAQCSSTAASCYEAQDGTVSAAVSGGTEPYSYSWSNGATTASVNGLSAGVYSVTVTDAEGCSTTCSAEVGQAVGLEIGCSGTPAVCNGDASGSASVSASGGTEPYSYLWSNGATTASVNGLESGVYTVVVTDAHGCSDECSYSVEEPFDLSAQCHSSDVLCFGGNDGSVSVSAAGGVAPYSYLWSNGSTDATVSGLTAGAYSVTVTDANGCVEICTAVVSQPQNELLATCEAGQVSCYGAGDGEAVVLAQGGTAPYTYFWNNEMTEPFIGNLVPGTYTVIVTDANGCTATCSVEVTEPEPFNISISADGPLTFCEGGSVTLTASEAASYVWSPNGETTQSIVVSISGNYSVWAVDETGCEATSDPVSVVVNPNPTPEVSANGPTTLCEGECVTLTSTAATSYLWNNGAATQSITVCEAGDYSVSVVDENGCEGTSAPVTVIVNTVEPPEIDVDGDATVCAGECVNLTVLYSGESPNFLWSNGETSQVISVCETGTFTVTYTAENGCSATSEPVTITVNPNPTPEVSAGGPTTFCEGECVTLTSSAASSYVWSNGATTQSITVCETGNYSVTITDENGCQGASAPVSVVVNPNPTPEISADGPTTFCEGECVTLTSSAASSYVWSNGATTQSITVCEAGDYSVSVIDENGCEGTSAPAAVVVNSNPTPIVSASGPTEFCEGECVTLTSSQAANYLWSNGATTQSITVCEAGSFTVSVVDENGCEGTSVPVSVTVNPNPTPTISADGPTSFCEGNCVTLTATASASYLWTNGATTQSITVCESGDYGVSVVDENGCQGGSVPVSVSVLEVEPPVINIDGSSTVCAGECVDLIALYSGESPNFVWSTGEVTQIITVCESGSYTVTLTAENGCTATSDPVVITVNPNPVPEVDADGPTTFCQGNCVTLTADAGYTSYLWNNGATTQSITVCDAGQYFVSVFDENSCRGVSAPVAVTVNIAITPTVTADGPTTICNGTCVILTASEAVSYLWSNGATTQSISVCAEGSFTVTVMDENGCSATSDPVSVTIIPGPTPEISPEGSVQICEGGCVTLSTSFSGEIGYFLWSNGETTQTITVCESGDYYVTVTDENGCSGTSADTVHVEIGQTVSPTVTADGPTEICEGDSVTLTANSPNAVSYQWYQNGIAIPGATGQSITVSDFADFYVVVTDQYGCTAQSNLVLVKVGEIPEVSLGEDVTICPGDEVTLTASGATYYVWSNGATTQSITVSPDEATDYLVTGTNPFCNLSDSDTVTVNISDLPVAAAEASDDPSLGNPVNFTDVSGDNSIVNWFWDFGDGNSAITQNTHHTYDTEGIFTVILTVENQYGCAAYDTLEVDINQVILIPNIITPNNDGLNDGFGIKNNGVDEYGLTIFNRWGQIVFERQAREIQWNGTTNSGTDLEAGTYFYVLVVDNGSKGTFEKTGFITLVR
jgi:gliding motility-associated-like protein